MTRRRDFPLLLACFVLSGVAGLIYESAWTQQFALVFGASELAVATVLAAYMAGLTVGAALAGRLVDRVRRPVRLYAILELGIALAALLVPFALRLATRLHVALLGGLELPADSGSLTSAVFYLAVAFAILMVPTGMMGATLPLLARHAVRADVELGRRVGWLYSANTVGAAGGALVAAFGLLPWLGLGRTVLVAAAINGLVFVLAVLLARSAPAPVEATPLEVSEVSVPSGGDPLGPPAAVILSLMLVSSFVSFTWEVLWTRLLSHLVGGSIYSFGTMLSTFLLGIGLGSAVAARWAVDRARAWHGFVVAQLGGGAASYLAFAAVDRLPWVIDSLSLESFAFMPPGALLAVVVLLPGTVFMGATFPFAVRILAGSASDAGPASARVFAWSTCGAITGAVGAGFVLLPSLRFAGTATLAVIVSLAVGLAAAWVARPRQGRLGAVAAVLLVVVAVLPLATPWEVLRTSSLSRQRARGEVAFFRVGRSSTVTLFEERGAWRLATNGLPESTIHARGVRAGRLLWARFMALLPLVGQPDARSYLVVGLGGGVTIEDVPAAIEEIHVVELEPEVVAANRAVSANRRRDPLADPRVRLYLNDARSALTLTEHRFDAVISQPSHPWTAGASHLFTRELFELVRERLQPGGVFVQWMSPGFADGELVRSLVATLLDVFPHVEVYRHLQTGPFVFLARVEPLAIDRTAALALAAGPEEWRGIGVRTPEDIKLSRVLDSEGAARFSAGAPLITDARNILQSRSPRRLSNAESGSSYPLFATYDPLTRPGTSDGTTFYYLRQLARFREIGRCRDLAARIADPSQRQVASGLLSVAAGRLRQGESILRASLGTISARSEAFHALVLLYRGQFLRGQVPWVLAARLNADPQARAVAEGWRLTGAGRLAEVRELEPWLAAIDPRHPLFTAATSLRIDWREAAGDPISAREALELLEPELLYRAEHLDGLIRRARLSVAAGDRWLAWGSLAELSEQVSPSRNASAADKGLQALETFPAAWRDERWARLREDLSRDSVAGD